MTAIEFFLSIILIGFSMWLIIVGRASFNSGDLYANVQSDRHVFLRQRESRIAEWRIAFSEWFRPIAFNLFAYPSHQRVFRIVVAVLGILPVTTCGILLLVVCQDVYKALLFFSLALILILLLHLEYLLACFGQLEAGGGGRADPFGLYTGIAQLPERVYVGDSKNISIRLSPEIQLFSADESAVTVGERTESQIDLDVKLPITINSGEPEYLEIGLRATGFQVGEEPEQRQKLSSHELVYAWNCYFPNSGDHAYIIRFRKIASTASIDIGHLEHKVRVVKIFNFTQNQVYAVAAVFGIPSGLYLFINGLKLIADVLSSLR
jgi:hypothetical protein